MPLRPWAAGGARVLAALGAADGTTRLVGGAVRDALIGIAVSDTDLATQLTPDAVVARLEAAGIKAVPTGIAHGTITAISHGETFEVTTLRRDVSTDGRHAVVAFSDDWRADAGRRDFTINALYADPLTGAVFDYFGGLDDLAARRVRFIGDAATRIAEDHLRILRFFRFHARFGVGAPDAAGLAACQARANDLMALSRERVRGELLKLLAVADPVPTITVMLNAGILAPVLPEVADIDRLAQMVAAEQAAALPAEPLRRLAALLPSDARVLDDVAGRLRLSNVERARLVAMAAPLQPVMFAEAYWDGAEAAIDRRLLAGETVAPLIGWVRPRFPLSGRDVIAGGVTPGPEVSRELGRLEREWVAAGFPATARTTKGSSV